MKDVRVGEY